MSGHIQRKQIGNSLTTKTCSINIIFEEAHCVTWSIRLIDENMLLQHHLTYGCDCWWIINGPSLLLTCTIHHIATRHILSMHDHDSILPWVCDLKTSDVDCTQVGNPTIGTFMTCTYSTHCKQAGLARDRTTQVTITQNMALFSVVHYRCQTLSSHIYFLIICVYAFLWVKPIYAQIILHWMKMAIIKQI